MRVIFSGYVIFCVKMEYMLLFSDIIIDYIYEKNYIVTYAKFVTIVTYRINFI